MIEIRVWHLSSDIFQDVSRPLLNISQLILPLGEKFRVSQTDCTWNLVNIKPLLSNFQVEILGSL